MTSIAIDRPEPVRIVTNVLVTDNSLVPTVLRVALGVVVLPHGLQKAFGWFDGWGFEGTMGWFASIGVPSILGILAILADLGALALIAGFATRLTAFGIGVNMIVAALLVHLPNGFFMNWSGKQAGEGYEFHILAAAMAIALVILGGGRWSVDRLLLSSRK